MISNVVSVYSVYSKPGLRETQCIRQWIVKIANLGYLDMKRKML